VRQVPHSKADINAFAASIAAIGMLQYPVVEAELGPRGKPTGNYLVNAGQINQSISRSIQQRRLKEPAWSIMIKARERLLAILLNARGAQTGQPVLIDRVLPRQELFNRERVAGASFLEGEEAATNRCDHFGLAPNDPAFRSRCRQVRNRQRASIGADHVFRPRTKGLIHE
jgi:hypothetical protein